MSSPQRDRGSISAFVVVLTAALIACAGLVLDGARILVAKVELADHAENAARAGAQMLTSLRNGEPLLDHRQARARAQAYLDAHGLSGRVLVTDREITVSVVVTVRTTLLSIVGITSTTVVASRTARVVISGETP